jgi:hypothetical protein
MADDPKNTGAPDRDLVALEQDHEVRYWTGRFGVNEQQLRQAVQQVGNSVAAGERALQGR